MNTREPLKYFYADRLRHAILHLQEMRKRGDAERIAEAEAAMKEALAPFENEIPVDASEE